ncbi:YfhO family protein [Lacibacter sp. H407]|uniref:YfhO family protein n=1 Tax=Lacibacter sp. H407 TaxID=3133423 RepID=UPI0030C55917
MKFDFKKLMPHAIAVVVFIVVALIYCKPVLEGKVLNATDNLGWKGMAQQSFEVREKQGIFPNWSNSMFGGMPTYHFAMEAKHKIMFAYVQEIIMLKLPKPANFFFLACICFYILGLSLRLNPWIAIMGALAYGYSTYNPVIIGAGHDTKMLAMGYAPLMIAGLLLLFQKRWWVGIAALITGTSLQISTGHLQIVYYTLIILAILCIGFLIDSFRKKEVAAAFKSFAIALFVGLVAFGSNAIHTLTNWDYAKESMRGGVSELKQTTDKNTTSGGLDKDYAFKYSVGVGETFTLLIPGIYGGSNGGSEYKKSAFADKLMEVGYPEDQALQSANGMSYWGDQQPTSGPVYFGAIVMLLFVFALFFEKGWLKWSLLAAGLFGVLLAWGKNVESINYFLFDYMPLYKKFRAPSMGLVIPQLCFVAMGAITLNNLLFGNNSADKIKKAWKNTAIASVALIALAAIMYFSFDYSSPNDSRIKDNMSGAMLQQYTQQGQQVTAEMQQQAETFGRSFITAIQTDRKGLFGGDLMRTVFLLALGLGLLWAFAYQKMKAFPVMITLLLISSFDVMAVGKRYINESSFVEPDEFDNSFILSEADKMIKQDTGYYRVLNTTTDFTNESFTSYHHNSIGGYHPAKLQIYQDLIENQIAKNNMQVLNMLNTKYFIVQNPQNGQRIAQMNPAAFGPVWFVKAIKYVADGREEMKALDSTNLRDTAVVQTKFKANIGSEPVADSTATIRLIENKNDYILYESSAAANQYAVFSEVYYPRGWKAFIDGKEVPIVKTNYALRGLPVPAGKHKIELKFEPRSYELGNSITMYASLLAFLLLFGSLFMEWRSSRKADS